MCDIFLGDPGTEPTWRNQPGSTGTGKERLCSPIVHYQGVTTSHPLESQTGPHTPLTSTVQLRTIFSLYPAHFFMPSTSGGSRFSPLTQKIKGIQVIQNQHLASLGFSFFDGSNCNSKTNMDCGLSVNKILASPRSQVEEIYINGADSRSELHWNRTSLVGDVNGVSSRSLSLRCLRLCWEYSRGQHQLNLSCGNGILHPCDFSHRQEEIFTLNTPFPSVDSLDTASIQRGVTIPHAKEFKGRFRDNLSEKLPVTQAGKKKGHWGPGSAKHKDSGRKSTANKNIIFNDDLVLMVSHLAFFKLLDIGGII